MNLTRLILFALLMLLSIQKSWASVAQTVLPLRFSQGLPSTSVEIQGKTIPLLFDTGASKDAAIALSPRALRGIHVRFTDKQDCGHTASGKICMKTFIIPQVKIGDFIVYNVKGELMQKLWGGGDGYLRIPAAKNGVLGLRLLRQFGVLIDYPHSRAILTRNFVYPQGYDIKNWPHVPFVFQDGISTKAQINGARVRLIWDTGAVPSVIKTAAMADAKTITCPPHARFNVVDCRYLPVPGFTISGQAIGDTWFLIQDVLLPFDGLVGANFFAKHAVFINAQNDSLAIKLSQSDIHNRANHTKYL